MPGPCRARSRTFADLANFKILGPVPLLVVVMLAVVAFIYWLLRSTSFGRNVYAMGGDFEVAKYSGINVRRTKAATYLICGLTAALGGVMLASQLNSASSIAGEDTALYVVCAVVVGGTSVAGGVGGAIKSAIGLLLLGLLTNAFNMLRIDSYGGISAHGPAGHHHRVDPVARQLHAESERGKPSRRAAGSRPGPAPRPVDRGDWRVRVTSVHLSATRGGYAADPTPSTVNTITHPVPSDIGRDLGRITADRDAISCMKCPLLRPSAVPLLPRGAGLS